MRHVPPQIAGRAIAVGGVVRDALLGLPPGRDLDLVVEGEMDPVPDWSAHDRFGTAIKVFPEGTLHVGMTRRERYPAPGALPEVEPGTLADDLARRDITVNAMALPLGGPDAGTLVDLYGGLEDLEEGVIRILRGDAFIEDPSRVIRAARYAGRLGMTLDPVTEYAARAAAPALDPSSARVAGELRRLLEERHPGEALELLEAIGVPWLTGRIGGIDRAASMPSAPDVPLWALRLGEAVVPEVQPVVALPGWARAIAREVVDGIALAEALRRDRRPSAVDRLLRAAPPAAQIGAEAAGAGAVAIWWAGDRDRVSEIRGSDLVAAGVAPGPAIGRALAEVRAALLDGAIETREDQLDLALRVAREEG
jgi:tRNA nucleotidyltransferase (CCA-adding enzyme)